MDQPTATAFDAIFNVFSTMSGGMINDFASVMTAIIVLLIIAMAIDLMSQAFWHGGSDLENDKWSRADNAEYTKYKNNKIRQDRFNDRYNWLDKG